MYSLVGHWLEIELGRDLIANTPVSLDRILGSIERNRLTRLVRLGTWAITCVGFIFLISRVVRSARDSGAHGMRFSPGLAAGVFFIPVYNFVGPYLAMQDAWRAAAPEEAGQEVRDEESSDDTSEEYRRFAPSTIIRLWWVAWLISRLTAVLTRGTGDTPEQLIEAHQAQMLSNGIDIVLVVVTLLMIRAVRSRLEHKWWSKHGGGIVPSARVRNMEATHA